MTEKFIHNTAPREVSGAITGDRLDYQYQRAAETCLTLLEDTETCCILLEWHDDFVKENLSSPSKCLYGFNQVKTRTASEGPWKISQVFGIPRAKSAPANSDSIAAKLYEHYLTFGGQCEEVVLVTNCGVDSDLDELVLAAKTATSSSALSGEALKNFKRISASWQMSGGPAAGKSDDEILSFISRIKLRPEAARIEQSSLDYRAILSDLILRFSEIDLTTSQSGKICSELLELVKEKSQHSVPLNRLPESAEELRCRKGIQVIDLLPLLSLSNDAYIELRKSGSPVVKTLSRLHRICQSSGLNDEQTISICKLKTAWDVWYFSKRSTFQDTDLALLRGECSGILDSYIKAKNFTFEQLVQNSEGIAQRYEPKLPIRGLNGELVVGLIFAIAAERGPAHAAI